MDTRRTRPSYLSEGEAEAERRRTEALARSIVKWKHVTRIGETSNFVVDFDGNLRLVIMYGKEVPTECQFKLAFDESETMAVIDLLKQARTFFGRTDKSESSMRLFSDCYRERGGFGERKSRVRCLHQ